MRSLRKRAGRRRRGLGAAGIGLILVGLVLAFGSLPASAAPSGSVSGVVRDGDGNPAGGICVTVQNGPGTRTDAAGAYTIGALASGTYALDVVDCNPTPHFVEQWYLGHRVAGDADPVTVTDGADTPLSDVTLERGVSIQGTVTGAGNPLTGMAVNVTPVAPGLPSASVQTDASGQYATSPLPPGDYRVGFSDPGPNPAWAPQYWKQQPDAGAANPVTLALSDGDVHGGIDAPLSPLAATEASIEGTVHGPSGDGLPNICVSVEVPRNGGGFDWIAGTNTAPAGTYRIDHLAPGDVRVHFRDCNNGPYIEQWYAGQANGDQSTPVSLTAGAVQSGIDATLARGVMVSGRAVDPQGNPIPGINVNVNPVDSGPSGWAQTDADGRYRTTGLPLGSYLVSFQDQRPTPVWASQYWDGAASRDSATVLRLTADDRPERAGVDATLSAGASVAGRVYAPGGGPAANICVNAVVLAGNNPDWIAGTSTSPDGSYRLGGLPTTAVRIMFQDCNNTGPYVTQWWQHQRDFEGATPLSLRPGAKRTGIDAHLTVAGALRGTVTDRAGRPLEGVCVQATAASFVGGLTRTAADGAYSLYLSRAGKFRVQFVDCTDRPQYSGQWWNAASAANATVITVASGQTVTNIDASLARGSCRHGVRQSREPQRRRDDNRVRRRLPAEPVRAVRAGQRRRHVLGAQRAVRDVRGRVPRLPTEPGAQRHGARSPVRGDELPGGVVEGRGHPPHAGRGRARSGRAGRRPRRDRARPARRRVRLVLRLRRAHDRLDHARPRRPHRRVHVRAARLAERDERGRGEGRARLHGQLHLDDRWHARFGPRHVVADHGHRSHRRRHLRL